MKALWYLLAIIVILYPVSSAACVLCSQWEYSMCIDPDLCYQDDYYRQLDREITYQFFNTGPTFESLFNNAASSWASVASITISEVYDFKGELDVYWRNNADPTSKPGLIYYSCFYSTGDVIATKIEVFNSIKSDITGNPLTWKWSNTCDLAADEINLWHVIAHELGHALGFCLEGLTPHPSSGSVMTNPSDRGTKASCRIAPTPRLLLLEVRVHPIDELTVVKHDILRFQDPVPLVGEVEEFRGDPLPQSTEYCEKGTGNQVTFGQFITDQHNSIILSTRIHDLRTCPKVSQTVPRPLGQVFIQLRPKVSQTVSHVGQYRPMNCLPVLDFASSV